VCKVERHTAVVETIATQLAAIPGVVAVTLGGSRATNTAVEGSDWDFGLYYRGRLDPADVAALGWPGRMFAPGEWGRIVNGGAGIATYVLTGELALGRVVTGELPRPRFPPRLRETAAGAWSRVAAGALHFAEVHADRDDRAACLANVCQAVLAAAQGQLAAAGEWILNEKRLVERAGLGSVNERLGQAGGDLPQLVADVAAVLGVRDPVWIEQ
jgi:hypothetical protein